MSGAGRSYKPDRSVRVKLQPLAARLHPGKLHLGFLADLLTEHTMPGETWLDPMAGSGSLLYGTQAPWAINVVLNELEAYWVAQQRTMWAHLRTASFITQGTASIRWGDARTLPARLARHGRYLDGICSSPPYGAALEQNSKIGKGLADYLATNPRAGRSSLMHEGHHAYTVDGVLTSPPYRDALTHQRHQQDYSQEPATAHWHSTDTAVNLRKGYDAPADGAPVPGQRNAAQIGNLRGARYERAMQEVYSACVPLVKPGGLVILVIKNVVENNTEVDLIGQARGQLEALGCEEVITHWRAVVPGAFHNIRRKQNPDALMIKAEAALVYRRIGATPPALVGEGVA